MCVLMRNNKNKRNYNSKGKKTFSLLKQLSSRIYLNIISNKIIQISLQMYIKVDRNKKTYIFHCFALKTDNSLFCHQDIPTIHNG